MPKIATWWAQRDDASVVGGRRPGRLGCAATAFARSSLTATSTDLDALVRPAPPAFPTSSISMPNSPLQSDAASQPAPQLDGLAQMPNSTAGVAADPLDASSSAAAAPVGADGSALQPPTPSTVRPSQSSGQVEIIQADLAHLLRCQELAVTRVVSPVAAVARTAHAPLSASAPLSTVRYSSPLCRSPLPVD